jgi:hypothetical protein
MITGLWEPWRLYLARMAIATQDNGAVATYIITHFIGVPAWWHCRWQLYLARMAWYLLHESPHNRCNLYNGATVAYGF